MEPKDDATEAGTADETTVDETSIEKELASAHAVTDVAASCAVGEGPAKSEEEPSSESPAPLDDDPYPTREEQEFRFCDGTEAQLIYKPGTGALRITVFGTDAEAEDGDLVADMTIYV